MAVKTIEMGKVKFKELTAAIKGLNDCGLAEKISTVGSSKEDLVQKFIAGVQSIPDDKEGNWTGPDAVAAYYQSIILAEDPVVAKKPEKPKKEKAAGKEAKPKKEKVPAADKGPSTKFLVYKAWKAKKDVPFDQLRKVGESVKESTIKTWLAWWKKGINLPAGAK